MNHKVNREMDFDDFNYCKAWASTGTNPEEDQESPPRTVPAVFSIVTHVTFLHLPHDYDPMEEDDPDFLHLVESKMEDVKVEIECHKLTDETTRRRAVEDMFACMHVPFKPFMVDEILTCALRMLNDTIYANGNVLYMEVQISLYVDELPLGVPILLSSPILYDNYDNDNDTDTSMVPASKSSIDKLKRVEIQESSQLCSICLEAFSCGYVATSMPCSHIFHGGCIEQWLIKCNSCPLCRFQMS